MVLSRWYGGGSGGNGVGGGVLVSSVRVGSGRLKTRLAPSHLHPYRRMLFLMVVVSEYGCKSNGSNVYLPCITRIVWIAGQNGL